jgi:hypothetical protein
MASSLLPLPHSNAALGMDDWAHCNEIELESCIGGLQEQIGQPRLSASTVAALANVDTEIARLESHIADMQESSQLRCVRTQVWQLRKYRNTLSPLLQLPHDILYYILTILVLSERKTLVTNDASTVFIGDIHDSSSHTTLTHIMGVCALFRHITAHSPKLWDHIELGRRDEWIELSTTRAANASISVTANLNTASKHVAQLAQMSKQIKHLNFWTISPQVVEDISTIHMPALRSVQFTAFRTWHESPPFVLNSGFFVNVCAHLSSLVVCQVELSDDTPSFPNLIYLDICDINVGASPERVLRFLKGSSKLKCVYINIAICDAEAKPMMNTNLNLSRLERLGISGDVSFIAAILPVLNMPPTGYCMIKPEPDSPDYGVDLPDLETLPSLRARHDQAFCAACKALGFAGMASVHLSMKPPAGRELSGALRPPYIRIHWARPTEQYSFCLWMEHALSENLGMTYEDHVWDIAYAGDPLNRVGTLHIHHNALTSFLRADIPELILLECLVIEVEGATVLEITELKEWLQTRAASGRLIPVLELRDCGYIFCRQRSYNSVTDFGEELLREEVVGTFLINGRPIS